MEKKREKRKERREDEFVQNRLNSGYEIKKVPGKKGPPDGGIRRLAH